MKKICLVLLFMFVAFTAQAQCVGEIKSVIQDEVRGSIIVETEYVLNGEVVQQGRTRYLETSGTNEEIIAKAKEDIEVHCKNLILRIEGNAEFRKVEMLKQQKALTAPIIVSIKDSLEGHKSKSITEVTDTFKGKDIKVTYDEKNTVTNTIAVVE